MQEKEFKNLQIKDKLIFNGGDDLKIDGFTDGNTYTVLNFDDYGEGVKMIDDYSNEIIMCNYYTKTYFNKKHDNVNHPSHYTWLKDKCGIEVIDITRNMDFNLGQVLKYILRLGHKSDDNFTHYEKILSDLHKANYYLTNEINKIDAICKKNGGR